MTVVYLDRVFLLNSVVDYLLFLCAARLCGFPLHRRRLIFCAVLGGVYAAAVFISELAFLAHPAIRLAFGGLLALAAFRRFRPVLTFFLLSAALAGTLLALGLAFGSVAGLAQRLYYADVSWQALIPGQYIVLRASPAFCRSGSTSWRGRIVADQSICRRKDTNRYRPARHW